MILHAKLESEHLYIFIVEMKENTESIRGFVPKNLLKVAEKYCHSFTKDISYYKMVLEYYLDLFEITPTDGALWMPDFETGKLEYENMSILFNSKYSLGDK